MKLPIRPITDPLYVIAVISNPRRYLSRYDLYRKFEQYVASSGAILITVEIAFGARPFEVTERDNPHHLQLRSSEELWLKECMINCGLAHLAKIDPDWKYVAWIDADVTFSRPDWVQETIQMLQHHDVVQLFSVAQDLSPTSEPFATHHGIVKTWINTGTISLDPQNPYCYSNGHPGYAWAATRYAIDTMGGIFDMAMMGAGDFHISLALLGMVEKSFQPGISEGYKHACLRYAERCAKLKKNIGYVEGLLLHHFHGKKSLRKYTSRWKVLTDNDFCPYNDMYKDSQGLWRLNGDKSEMRMQMALYLAGRNEDDISMD